jgi:hypothetical protein
VVELKRSCVECALPFIPRKASDRRCPSHQREHDRDRHHPGYDDRRYRQAQRKLKLNWIRCARCPKRATTPHHRDRNPANNDPSNHEFLCDDCHATEHHPARAGAKGGRVDL